MAKLFISHAWEDKAFARPLAEALKQNHHVWFDEYSLNIGDSLRAKIDEGLANCDFGVVILSRNFFNKNWTQNELDGLMALERAYRKMILPVWLDITRAELEKLSPMLALRVASLASKGVHVVADEISRSISISEQQRSLDENKKGREALRNLIKSEKGKQFEEALFSTERGVSLFREARSAIYQELQSDISSIDKSGEMFRVDARNADNFVIHGINRCSITIASRSLYLNSIREARLSVLVWRRPDFPRNMRDGDQIDEFEYFPMCRSEGEFLWRNDDTEAPKSNRDVAQDILKRYSEAARTPFDEFEE